MSKFLIVGAGGFIGGHLIKRLLSEKKHFIRAVDLKPLDLWFQKFDNVENFSLDMQEYENCIKMTNNVDFVINLACNMGGIGFIENNKADCMLSVLINTNLLRSCLINKIKRYFFSSSACAYNKDLQTSPNIKGLREIVERDNSGEVFNKTSENLSKVILNSLKNNNQETYRDNIKKSKSKYTWSRFIQEIEKV